MDRFVVTRADPGFVQLARADFRSLDEVFRLAERVRRQHCRLDLLVNNTRVLAPPDLTCDGIEATVTLPFGCGRRTHACWAGATPRPASAGAGPGPRLAGTVIVRGDKCCMYG